MRYTARDFVDALNLQPGHAVHLALNALPRGDSQSSGARWDFEYFDIALWFSWDGDKAYQLPIAAVLRANRRGVPFGNQEQRLQAINQILPARGRAQGLIITQFFEPIPLALEPDLSSDSIVYVFAGLVAYASEVAARIDHAGQPQHLTIAGRRMPPTLLATLATATVGEFQGYRSRILEDYDILREVRGLRPLSRRP